LRLLVPYSSHAEPFPHIVRSLTDFELNTSWLLRQLKKTGNPLVLTFNGEAELVAQAAACFQQVFELAERVEPSEPTRRAWPRLKAAKAAPWITYSTPLRGSPLDQDSAVTYQIVIQPRADRGIRTAALSILGR
jgi:hypothetical protein